MTLKPLNIVKKKYTFCKEKGASFTKKIVPLKRSVATAISPGETESLPAAHRASRPNHVSSEAVTETTGPQSFFGFPFHWVWTNSIAAAKFQANRSTSSQQIHILQDFNLVSDGDAQKIEYTTSYVAVFVINFQYADSSRYVVAVCSACRSAGDLIKFIHNLGGESPPFQAGDCFGCQHTTLTVATLLRSNLNDLKSINSPAHASLKLSQILTAVPDIEFGFNGWQPIPVDWMTRRGYLAVFMTSSPYIRLLSVCKKVERRGHITYYCHLCKKKGCHHIREELCDAKDDDIFDDYPFDFEDDSESVPAEKMKDIISQQPYPCTYLDDTAFDLLVDRMSDDVELQTLIRSRSTNGMHWFKDRFPDQILISSQICCENQAWEVADTRACIVFHSNLVYAVVILIDPIQYFHFFIKTLRCFVCKKMLPYDGRNDGLVNFRNKYIFSCELFYELLNMKSTSGLPTNSWWLNLLEFYKEIGLHEGNQKEITSFECLAGIVNQYFCQFLDLLYDKHNSFSCCDNPDIVMLDGIVMSIEASRILRQKLEAPWIIGQSNTRVSERASRSIICFSKEHAERLKSYTKEQGLSEDSLRILVEVYRGNPCIDLLKALCASQGAPFHCPQNIEIFFRSIRKSVCPAISITPKEVWDNVRLYIGTGEGLDLLYNKAQSISPVLESLVSLLLEDKREAVELAAMRILALSLKESKKMATLQDPGHVEPFTEVDEHSPEKEMERTGVFFPGRPVVRRVKRVDFGGAKEEQCTKDYQSNSRLGNGLVLFWCGRHRTCLGWILLRSPESLEIVYTTLLTRFPVLPKIVCYDNACNLAEYCYNRAPRYFSDTHFIVDGFHFEGHINCSYGYNSNLVLDMKDVSSVLHEQMNARLAKMKIPTMYMRFDSFLSLMKALTTLMNIRELNK